jgi:hypothetical protein
MGPPASHPVSAVPLREDAPAGVASGGIVLPFGEEPTAAGSTVPAACFDAVSKWLEIAIRYASDAQVAKHARVAAWEGTDEAARAAALEWEFEVSMQAIVACGVAVDSLSDMLQTRVELPRLLIDKWRENRTPHCIRVSEVFGRALSLAPKATTALHQNLSEILRFRDLAVGATAKANALILHPELQTGIEWRFVYFRCENALTIVRATSRLVWGLAASGKPRDPEVQKYLDAVRSRIEAIPGSLAFRA